MAINITGSNRFARRRNHTFHWTVELPRISNNISGDYDMEVHSCTIENLFPVIRQGYNDTLYFTYNGNQSYFTFQEGNYTINELLNSVETSLQTLNIGFALSYDSLQFKVSLFIPANVTFSIRRTVSLTDDPNDYSYPNSSDLFLELLGWNFKQLSLDFAGGAAGYTWIPNNVVRCIGPLYVDLCTNLPVRGSYSQSKGKFNVISRIYIGSEPYGSTVTQINVRPEKYLVNLSGISEFDLFLIDSHGHLVLPFSSIDNVVVAYRISFLTTAS